MTEHYNQPEKRVVYATRTSDTLGAIAHKAFALPLSPTTQQRWDQLMMLMREADDIAGNITPDAATLRMHAEQSGAYDRYPLLHPDNFSASTAAELEHTIVQLFMLDRQLATATDIAHYVAAREHEARLTAHLFALTADYDTAQQPQFTEFMQALSQLAVAAGSLDTAIDARRDFTQGDLAITPTVRMRSQLIKHSIGTLASTDMRVFSPKLAGTYLKLGARSLMSHHVRNQLERQTK